MLPCASFLTLGACLPSLALARDPGPKEEHHEAAVEQMTDDEAFHSVEDEHEEPEEELEHEEEPEPEPNPFAPSSNGTARVSLVAALGTGDGTGWGLQGGYEHVLLPRLGPGRLMLGGVLQVMRASRKTQNASPTGQGHPWQEEHARSRLALPVVAFARYVLEFHELLRPWALAGLGPAVRRTNHTMQVRFWNLMVQDWNPWRMGEGFPRVATKLGASIPLGVGLDVNLSDTMVLALGLTRFTGLQGQTAITLGVGNR